MNLEEYPLIGEFRNSLIPEAIQRGFVNIANFFRERGYPIIELSSGGNSPWMDDIPENPVVQFWYRSPLLKPQLVDDYKTYLQSYHSMISTVIIAVLSVFQLIG